MRMLLPSVRVRRAVDEGLSLFYQAHETDDFWVAMKLLTDFYKVPKPKVMWRRQLEEGRTLGLTTWQGNLHLIHPKHWEDTERLWIGTVLHEVWHMLGTPDEEAKADQYARKFVRGLR